MTAPLLAAALGYALAVAAVAAVAVLALAGAVVVGACMVSGRISEQERKHGRE